MSDKYLATMLLAESHTDYRPGDKVVLQVVFQGGGKIYCYTADGGNYYSGEKMYVWADGKYVPVTVVLARYYYPEDYPFTKLRLKKAVRMEDKTSKTPAYSKKATNATSAKAKKPERRKPDWLLEEDEPETYSTSSYKSPLIDRSNTTSNTVDDSTSNTRPAESTHYYGSSSSPEKPKSHKLLIALIVIAVIGIIQGPTWYKNYIDSKPLNNTDIVGTWESEYGIQEVVFSSDHSAKVSGENYLTGKWEIASESQQTIRLHYIVTDSQLDQYNDEFYYDMDGYIATKEDVLEWEMEYQDDLPPEGTYRFKRSDNRLICEDYDDYYLEKR